jgi:hypothetical protein
LAPGIATVTYAAIALGVFGTLTVEKVIASGGTAIAIAAEPTLGPGRLLADDRHRAIRHRRGHQGRETGTSRISWLTSGGG